MTIVDIIMQQAVRNFEQVAGRKPTAKEIKQLRTDIERQMKRSSK